MFVFFTETGLEGVYLISHALLTLKTTFNKRTYELACQYIVCYKSCAPEHHKKSHYALQW